MIWAPDAAAAITLAARAVDEVGVRADLLPVRVGVHTGPAVMQGRDWYGSAVNVAARPAGEAQPNQALISGTTRLAAHGASVNRLGPQRDLLLRSLARPVAARPLA